MALCVGLDFGLSNLDAVLMDGPNVVNRWKLATRQPASLTVVQEALEAGGVRLAELSRIATTGGRHHELPDVFERVPLHKVNEAVAIGRGGLALSGVNQALVVSAGSGAAMVGAWPERCAHVGGTAVGGGTLVGLSKLLLGTTDPLAIDALAQKGDRNGVDTTLGEAIGSGIGEFAAQGTAVNFGRVIQMNHPPKPEDLAAGLVTMVAQVVGIIAIGVAQNQRLSQIVVVGHLIDLPSFGAALDVVWRYFALDPYPIVPEHSGWATAVGAALAP